MLGETLMDFSSFLADNVSRKALPTYVYGYPSKRTYRNFSNPLTMDDIVSAAAGFTGVNLYFHIPFCRYRCTYCTLFLTTRHSDDLKQAYVDRLIEYIRGYGRYFSDHTVESIYFGGGTPTLLTAKQFEQLFQAIHASFPKVAEKCEITVEAAPDCLGDELLDAIRDLGVNRMSMGIQSMQPGELSHSGRPYAIDVAREAITAISSRFAHVNLDLIYGLRGQSRDSWNQSLAEIIDYGPTTLSLYPVVVRPLTNISKTAVNDPELFFSAEEKYDIYDENVEKMARHGYKQESFTRFTRLPSGDAYQQEASDFAGTPLIGFGAGARSHIGRYHFSTDYAVDRTVALDIVKSYADRPFNAQAIASQGITLSEEEMERRFVLLNLTLSHLDRKLYRQRFKKSIDTMFSEQLRALTSNGFITETGDGRLLLTTRGYKYSNIIARVFYSDRMIELENSYQSV
ncbi:coproporphyrinogen-III oxidase family protein [Gluconacetobacter asukensis]|uniref:Radical SAM protein n=1 Tax=Gluconacetobacter asukensis TaxID=1017181 RepID=A0A7W4J1G8_9PROT|nr:radical SAM protein [Gluconacetobacter asukensis]MBB2172944.1 radical SAM protein [Gluconacetobacter asukensis]